MATQIDFRTNNGLVVGGNTFTTAVINNTSRNTSYSVGQIVLNTNTNSFDTYYSNTQGSNWISLSTTPTVIFPVGDFHDVFANSSFMANENIAAQIYDCSTFPINSISTYDLNI
jgi:hypothetical protein